MNTQYYVIGQEAKSLNLSLTILQKKIAHGVILQSAVVVSKVCWFSKLAEEQGESS